MNAAVEKSGASSGPARTVGALLILGAAVTVFEERYGLSWLAAFAAMSGLWLVALRLERVSPGLLLGVAVLIRCMFFIIPPEADIYRYLWEGGVILEGANPYLYPPDAPELMSLRSHHWTAVDHRGVTAIYPPLAQWVFAALRGIGGGVSTFKAVFGLADVLLCVALLRSFGAKRALIYAWNPLVAYSFAGGGHYDSLFMICCTAGWLAWRPARRVTWKVALWAGVAIALKWMALPIALWILAESWKRRGPRGVLASGMWIGAPLLVSWLLLGLWTGEWTIRLAPTGFASVARSAEFIPALVREFTGHFFWHNGWFLGAMLVAWLASGFRSRSYGEAAELGFHAAYLLSPMIHAWYFAWALPFAVASRNAGSLAIAASGIGYFVILRTQGLTGEWTSDGWLRAAIWLPFGWCLVMRRRVPKRACVENSSTGLNAE